MPKREAPSRELGGVILTRLTAALAAGAALLACSSDDKSATELNPEGPPMVQQLFVQEKVIAGDDVRERRGLAFGDHPEILSADEDPVLGDDRVVTNAVAFGGDDQKMRLVVDELLRGNFLEEIACFNGSYSRVPVGADPDDISDCSPPDLSRCQAVCTGDAGGILDINQDGSVDDTRMIDYGDGELAVSVVCDGERMPLDREETFYNPSGNQLIPAGPIGLDGLGPAIVIVPSEGLRTGVDCTVTFRPEVVDKDDNQVCAPPDGDVSRDCSPGNTDAITFRVEPLSISQSEPSDGATDVDVSGSGGADPYITLQFVANLAIDSLDAITLSTGGTDVPVEVQTVEDDTSLVLVTVPGGYLAETEYTLTIGTGVADALGGTVPEDITLTFTTGAADADPPDAGTPDAGADAAPPDAAI